MLVVIILNRVKSLKYVLSIFMLIKKNYFSVTFSPKLHCSLKLSVLQLYLYCHHSVRFQCFIDLVLFFLSCKCRDLSGFNVGS
ncbi:hypothetical protein FKM82_000087 [Ascaphus truei]